MKGAIADASSKCKAQSKSTAKYYSNYQPTTPLANASSKCKAQSNPTAQYHSNSQPTTPLANASSKCKAQYKPKAQYYSNHRPTRPTSWPESHPTTQSAIATPPGHSSNRTTSTTSPSNFLSPKTTPKSKPTQ